MKVGFTGTRHGMTAEQLSSLKKMLAELAPEEFHHGDCVGADDQAHSAYRFRFLWLDLGCVVTHPGPEGPMSANCPADVVRPRKPYLERNRDIVDETDMLIACPQSEREEQRSGTWATVRYARKLGRRVSIIFPDGCGIDEGGE